jgi:hypothetical protein
MRRRRTADNWLLLTLARWSTELRVPIRWQTWLACHRIGNDGAPGDCKVRRHWVRAGFMCGSHADKVGATNPIVGSESHTGKFKQHVCFQFLFVQSMLDEVTYADDPFQLTVVDDREVANLCQRHRRESGVNSIR